MGQSITKVTTRSKERTHQLKGHTEHTNKFLYFLMWQYFLICQHFIQFIIDL